MRPSSFFLPTTLDVSQAYIAMENGPFEGVVPIKNGDIPASYVSLPEGKWSLFLDLPTCNGGRSLAQREILQRSRDAENVEFLGAKAWG